MEIKKWKNGSSHVAIVLDHDEYSLLRNILMQSRENHCPGDGTCNGHAWKVMSEICRLPFNELMEFPPMMVYPGGGESDRITINLNGHDYTDFQELLEHWMKEWNKSENIVEIAIADAIINAKWGQLWDGEKVVFEI